MFDFLQNSWVVGIGGGIISGIIVYVFTNWLYKRKDNSKYLEQINRANADIIHALKPYVAEIGLPEKEIVDAIIVSTARKYNVKSEELYSIRIICEELIREIIENAYVSSEKKQEYALQLKNYLHTLVEEERLKSFLISDIEKEIGNVDVFAKLNYRRKTITTISAFLSVFAGILTTMSLWFSISELNSINISKDIIDMMFLILLPIIFVIGVVYFSVSLLNRIEKNKDNEKKSQNDES